MAGEICAHRRSSSTTGRLEPHPPHRAALADAFEKGEVLREAAERDVLPVVRRRRRVALSLRQRLDGAAERRPGLEERDVVTRVHQFECSGAACEAAADHGGLHRRRPPPTIRSFVSVESCGGPSKTSKPRASMRSSVAR